MVSLTFEELFEVRRRAEGVSLFNAIKNPLTQSPGVFKISAISLSDVHNHAVYLVVMSK